LRDEIVRSTIAGDYQDLIYALSDYSYYRGIVAEKGNPTEAMQAINRAIEFTRRLPEPNDTLLLCTLCAKGILMIKSALVGGTEQSIFDSINDMYDQINNLCNRSHSIHAAGAVALSRLASWLGSLHTLADVLPKMEELHKHIAAIGSQLD
jgi:hypothetical protein